MGLRTAYHMNDGGRVPGKGDGTVDKVPALYAPGEYVLPADTAKAVGYGNLDSLRAATHTPVSEQRGEHAEQTVAQRDSPFLRGTARGENETLRQGAEVDGNLVGRFNTAAAGGQRHLRDSATLDGVGRRTLRLADGGYDLFARPLQPGEEPLYGQKSTLRNPSFDATGTSQEGRAFQAERTASPPTAAPAAPADNPGKLRSAARSAGSFFTGSGESGGSVAGAIKNVVGPVAGTALRAAGKLAAPAAIGGAIYGGATTATEDYAKQLGLENTEPGVLRDLGVRALGVAQDTVGLRGTDTETYAKRFGLQNTEPGFLRDLGVRALGVGSDVLSFGQAKRLDDTPAVPRPAKPQFAVASDAGVAPTLRNAEAPQLVKNQTPAQEFGPTINESGQPTLRGQLGASVAGAPGVSKFVQDGRTFYSNVPGSNDDAFSRPGVNTVPAASLRGSSSLDEALSQARRAAVDRGESLGPGFSGTIGTPVAGSLRQDPRQEAYNERRGAQFTLSSRLSSKADKAAAAAFIAQQDKAATDQSIEGLRSRTELAKTDRQSAVTLRGQDIASADHRYTADQGLQGHLATAAGQRAKLEYEARKDDRQYKFDVEKYGTERADKQFEQRQKAQKDLHDEIGNLLPPGPDGKPDAAAAARYSQGLLSRVAAQQRVLEQRAKAGDAGAKAALDDLNARGMAALDPQYKRKLILGMQAKEQAERYHSGALDPIGGTAVTSDEPIETLRKTSDGFLGIGGEYTSNRGDKIPARAIEGDGSFFGGRLRRDFEPLIRK